MRPLPALALALLGLGLSACRCTPDDGWPHLEDHRWRVVLDPAGAHSFTQQRGHAPVVLMHRGDPRTADVLLAGYRGTARTTLSTFHPAWDACDAPALPSGLRSSQPDAPLEHPGVAWVGPATLVEIPTPPANPSQAVVAAGVALQSLAGPGHEVRVRTLIKQRRPNAPPLQLVVGDADCTGLVALLDTDLEPLVSDSFQLPGPTCAPMAAMPPADFDGDGKRELVLRAGNGEPDVGVLRAVYHIELNPPSLERVWHSSFTASCPD